MQGMTLYQYRIDLDDPNETHVRQLRLIGSDRTVLELGCGSGAMTSALRAQGCRVTGVELDPQAAAKAAEFAERVVLADLDQPGALDELAGERFDIVLAGDVLEHLRDPGPLLVAAARLLTDEGYLVASIPNIAHGSTRLGLLQGRWDYADDGLLDRTHLRFFTRTTVEELFTEAGLRIEHLERVYAGPFDLDPLLALGDFPPGTVEMVAEDPESATVQFVLAAVPTQRPADGLRITPEPAELSRTRAEDDRTPPARTQPRERGEREPVDGVRAVAFYLPQFHPVPENDAWWGRGFTEWTNVSRAEPIWPGHPQPRRPTELGYYDLRVPEVREAQAALAADHGISAFVYHHYWFGGRRMLARPFEEVLASGRPGLPFALCWANEPWTRVWDANTAVLVDQVYDDDERRRHAQWLAAAFADPRYLRVEGRPLFVIYHVNHLPKTRRYIEEFRQACLDEAGEDPYLVQAVTHDLEATPQQTGCDAEVEFPPHRLGDRAQLDTDPRLAAGSHHRYAYDDVVDGCLDRLDVPWVRYPCVVPGWDNTARRRVRATILHGADPESYERWLAGAAEHEARRRPGQGLVFVNAWNEWAEGAYLEPDELHGRGYLEATRRVFGTTAQLDTAAQPGTAAHPGAAAQPGTGAGHLALPSDYLSLRERVVELEAAMASASAAGEKAARAAHRRHDIAHQKLVTHLRRTIVEIQDGADQTAEWARSMEQQLTEKLVQIEELGHYARGLEVEIEAKNQVLAETSAYARQLEGQVADRDRRLGDLELRLLHPQPSA